MKENSLLLGRWKSVWQKSGFKDKNNWFFIK